VTLDQVQVSRPRLDPESPDSRPLPGERREPLVDESPTAPKTSPSVFPILTTRALHYFSAGVALLALINVANDSIGRPFWTITRFIYLGDDGNVSAWYSSILLILAAALALKCYGISRSQNREHPWAFALLAGLLAAMSCDEIARFHESLGDFASRFYEPSTQEISKHAGWVWIGGPIVITAFAAFIFLLRKPLGSAPGCFSLLNVGFASIVLGGVLLEATINWMNHEELQWLWNLEVIAEETLEMAGTMLIAYSLARWIEVSLASRRSWSLPPSPSA
jgi:hypothetical protein